MNQRTHLLVVMAAATLAAVILAVALAQCDDRHTPAAETLAAPTPTPTEGEKAAAAVGQEHIAYTRTRTECEQLVESGETEGCVWLDVAKLITRPEWEQLLPNTNFYILGLKGYNLSHRLSFNPTEFPTPPPRLAGSRRRKPAPLHALCHDREPCPDAGVRSRP
jgi:hypothetical protein